MEAEKPVWPGALNNLPAIAKVTSPTFIESLFVAPYCNIRVSSTNACCLLRKDMPAVSGEVSSEP